MRVIRVCIANPNQTSPTIISFRVRVRTAKESSIRVRVRVRIAKESTLVHRAAIAFVTNISLRGSILRTEPHAGIHGRWPPGTSN